MGNFNTDYSGKAKACIQGLRNGYDFIFVLVHIEAPDECGHRNEVMNKVRSIELIDENIVGPVLAELEQYDDFKIMALADHPTPLSVRTYTRDAVPFTVSKKETAVTAHCLSRKKTQQKRVSSTKKASF